MIIKTVNMGDDFTCSCGNTASQDGFQPSNIFGIPQEPEGDWDSHYRCDRCLQVYQHKED